MKKKTRKNAVVLTAATAGAVAGNAMVPVVGAMIGWTVAGGIARVAVGGFEKDDKQNKLNAGGYYMHQQNKQRRNR